MLKIPASSILVRKLIGESLSGSIPGKYAEVTISSVEVLALRATPKVLVAAPGAGKVIELVSGILILDYNSAVYTESTDNLAVRYGNGAGAAASDTIETTGFLDQAGDRIICIQSIKDVLMVPNAPLVLHNIGDGEFAAGNSPLRAKIFYRVHLTGL